MNDANLPLLPDTPPAADASGSCPEAEARRRAVRALRVALQVAGRIAREGGLSGTLHAVEAAEFKLLDEVGLEAFAACTARTFQPPCAAGVGAGAQCEEFEGRRKRDQVDHRAPGLKGERGRAAQPTG